MNIIYIVIAIVVIYWLMNKSQSEGFAETSNKVKCTYFSAEKEKMVYGLTEKENCQGGYTPEFN